VATERGREYALVIGLVTVVELLDHPVAQLGEQRFDLHARNDRLEQPAEPLQLPQVRAQCLAGARILHFDRDVTAVMPHRPVYLPDAGGRRRFVGELGEAATPPRAELLVEHPLHGLWRHRRCGGLQFRQGFPVRRRQLLRDRRLEYAQRLAELHRAAFELTKHRKELLGGARAELRVDDLGIVPGQPPAPTRGDPPGHPERKAREPSGSLRGAARDVGHGVIVSRQRCRQ
jgi:hypothetical protein